MKIRNILILLPLLYIFQMVQTQELSIVPVQELSKVEEIPLKKRLVAYFSFSTEARTVTFKQKTLDDNNELRWSMGDGTVYTTSSFKHTYKKKGKYLVTLIVKNSFGIEVGKFMNEVNITK